MNLKEMKEKANILVEQMETETRSETFNVETFKKLENEHRSLTQQIEEFDNNLEFTTIEKREGNKVNKELRNMLASQNASVMKEEVFNGLIEKIDTDADVLALAETIVNNGETLKFTVEDSTQMEAVAVAEGIPVTDVQPILKSIVAQPTRKGAYLEVSKEMLTGLGNASYEAHLQELLFGSVSRKLRNDMITVLKTNTEVEVIETITVAISIDDVAELILSAPQGQYAIVGHPTVIRGLKKLKDATGHFYVQNGVVNGVLTSSYMGCPLVEHRGMDTLAASKIVLALVGQGAVKQVISKDVEIEPIYGENVKQGIRVYNIDIISDVVVAEEDRVKLLKVKAEA